MKSILTLCNANKGITLIRGCFLLFFTLSFGLSLQAQTCEINAVNDSGSTCPGIQTCFDVSSNDQTQTGAFNIDYSIVNGPATGTGSATLSNNGQFCYDPGSFTGTANVTYELCYDVPGHTSTTTGNGAIIFNNCGDNKIVDTYMQGLEAGGTSMNIPNCANFNKMVVEIYIDDHGCDFVAPPSLIIEGVTVLATNIFQVDGVLSNSKIYRTTITTCDGTINFSGADCYSSIAAYVERNQDGGASTVVVSDIENWYPWANPAEVVTTLPIGTADSARDFNLKIPIHEKSSDGRPATIEATACGVTSTVTLTTANSGPGAGLANLSLLNVPGTCDEIVIKTISPQFDPATNIGGDSFSIGAVSVSSSECSPSELTCCEEANVSITVIGQPTNGGTLSADQAQCGSYDPANIIGTAATGGNTTPNYRWLKRTFSCATNAYGTWAIIASATGINYNPPSISITTQYIRQARVGSCNNWINSTIVTKYVTKNFTDAGTISGEEAKCGSYDPGIISSTAAPSGSDCIGTTIYAWQKRTYDCATTSWGNYSTISGATSLTYNPPSISISTQYRRLVRKQHCTSWIYSTPVTKYVTQNFTNGGTIAGNQTVCGGYNPTAIGNTASPSGQTCVGNNIYAWQKRTYNCTTSSWSTFTTVAGATGLTYDPATINVTTQYRRRAKKQHCTTWVNSNVVTKYVVTNFSDPGTIAGSETKCGGYNPTAITNAASPSGSCFGTTTYAWQKRSYNCNTATWSAYTTISGATAATYNPGAITVSTQYRRLARKAPCTTWNYSNVISKIVVTNFSAPGSIAGDQTVCGSYNPTLITNAASPSGSCFGTTVYAWQKRAYNCSTASWATFTTIAGASEATYDPSNISVTTQYRRLSRKAPCTDWQISNVISKEVVSNFTAAGEIESNESGCETFNPALINSVSLPSGSCFGTTVYGWEKRDYNCSTGIWSSWSTVSGATGVTYNPGNISSTTQYRRTARKAPCTSLVRSNVITKYAVGNFTDAGSISGEQSQCGSYDPSAIQNTVPPSGNCFGTTVYAWQERTKDCSSGAWSTYSTISGATGASYNPTTINVTTQYRRLARKAPCTTWVFSTPILKEVIENVSVNNIASNQQFCDSGNPSALTGTAASGGCGSNVTYLWQFRNGTSGSWSNLAGQNGVSYDPPVLNSTTQYRRLARRLPCPWMESNVITIDVNSNTSAAAGPDVDVCDGNSVILTASGGVSYLWSNNLTSSSITVTPNATTQYIVTVTDANGCTDTDDVLVTLLPSPSASIDGDLTICGNTTTTLTASGGVYYSWTTGSAAASIITGPGTYTVTVIDNNGCIDTETVTVDQTIIDTAIQGPAQVCATEPAQFQVNPPIAGATYTWTAGGNPSITVGSTTSSNLTYVWPVPGSHTVTLEVELDDCVETYTHAIEVTNEVISDAGPDVDVCQGGCALLNGSGSSVGQYQWTVVSGDFFGVIDGGNTTTPSVCPNVTTEYELSVTDPANGCVTIDRVVVNVDVDYNPTAIASYDPSPTVCIGSDVTLIGSNSLPPVTNPSAVLTYAWYNDVPPAGALSTQADPVFTITQSGTYTLIVSDGGCNDTTSIDITVTPCSEIGDFIWHDTNGDGIQDPTEPGFAGVTVTLTGSKTASGAPVTRTMQTSDGTMDVDGDGIIDPIGYYNFTALTAGSYFVEMTVPNGYILTGINEGNDDNLDSDFSNISNQTTKITIGQNDIITDVDGGIHQPVSIGSSIFVDNNDNGVLDGNESKLTDPSKINMIVVNLYEDANNNGQRDPLEIASALQSTTLNADGTYLFDNLAPGNYFIGFVPPASLSRSSTGATGDDQVDNNDNGEQNGADGTVIYSSVINLSVGDEPVNGVESGSGALSDDAADSNGDMTVDFGLYEPASVSGVVSVDTDNNDTGDSPLGGVVITLIDKSNGTTVGVTTTNSVAADLDGDGIPEPIGAYYFGDLSPGNYTLVETQPTGYTSVSDEDGSDDGDPNDGNDPVNNSIPVVLTSGENDTDNDFIEEQNLSIGSSIFVDDNDNGMLDANESKLTDPSKINMIVVSLYEDANNNGQRDASETGSAVQSTSLNSNGTYYFDNLAPGNYFIGFIPPASLSRSSTGAAGDDQVDNDDNGEQNGPDGSVIYSSVINLAVGTEPTNGVEFGSGAMNDDAADNNGDMTVDFGLYEPASISGNVTVDDDNDGSGDQPLGGVVITLIDKSNGTTVGMTTSNSVPTDLDGDGINEPIGDYYFGDLSPGNYTLVETQPTDYSSVSDQDESNDGDPNDGNDPTNNSIPVILTSGEDDTDNNFVEGYDASIGSLVWNDEDNDGFKDPNETGIQGVVVEVYLDSNRDGIADTPGIPSGTDTTDADGIWFVGGLSPDDYLVIIPNAPMSSKQNGQVTSMISSTPNVTDYNDNSLDDNDNGIQGDTDGDGVFDGPISSPTITLTIGGETSNEPGLGGNGDLVDANGDMTVDFGFFTPAHIGDFVWFDEGNGTPDEQNANIDLPVPGVTVNLLDAFGSPILGAFGVPRTTTTDANGNYVFEGLAPGTYSVEFDLSSVPSGSSLSFVNPNAPGVADNNDSDAIPQPGGTGITGAYTLGAGDFEMTVDAGLQLSVVPITLVDFYGRFNETKVLNELVWITASEINNEKFIVERSIDNADNFESIGEVVGNGNSSTEITYNFNDEDVATNGLYFYRLRQVDYNGREDVLGPIAIKVARQAKTEVDLYPNPAHDQVTFKVNTPVLADLQVSLFTIAGKSIQTNFSNRSVKAGVNEVKMDISNIPAGTYVFRVAVGNNSFIKKIVILE